MKKIAPPSSVTGDFVLVYNAKNNDKVNWGFNSEMISCLSYQFQIWIVKMNATEFN